MATKQILVPDIGDFSDVAIIDVYISEGDVIEVDDPVIALESAKAVTDIPSPYAGTIKKVHVKEGDLVSKDSLLADIEVEEAEQKQEETDKKVETQHEEIVEQPQEETGKEEDKEPQKEEKEEAPPKKAPVNAQQPGAVYHATPSVRQYARELGVELSSVEGSGPHGRITREDVQQLVKSVLKNGSVASTPVSFELEDFSVYGEIERKPLTRIQKISGPHLQRSWQTIPLVTQFDEADVTDLETFRHTLKEEMARVPKEQQVKISILPFIVKAVTAALDAYPELNSSYDGASGELIIKKYRHIGIAVDTPDGLMVPVLRDADKKGVKEIAAELSLLGEKARNGKLGTKDISGASFSISSLGGIGGTMFTPIINPPEAAILGVSKITKKPMWNGKEFVPRDMLPLSLSYDHRVIDGALGARFVTYLSSLLGDIKRILL
jgi:pyruvate dehydrogenase E2 component (dihydrolipoamide acetyltransferase)